MGADSKIEWCDHTFNPWVGCQKVSPGCDHCYAEGWAKRSGMVTWGPHGTRKLTSAANWRQPLRWNAQAEREGRRFRVFCASLADVFDNRVPQQWHSELFDLIERTPHLDWLLLTKRPQNIPDLIWPKWDDGLPLNIWLGTTVENQEEADRRIFHLIRVPAAVHFLSCEPLLGPVDLSLPMQEYQHRPSFISRINWVIAGGESGGKARPMAPIWAKSLRDQCAAAGVPFLFKQWGEWAPTRPVPGGDFGADMRAGRVVQVYGDGREPDGHFRAGDAHLRRVGKATAGRRLDGATHDGFPQGLRAAPSKLPV